MKRGNTIIMMPESTVSTGSVTHKIESTFVKVLMNNLCSHFGKAHSCQK